MPTEYPPVTVVIPNYNGKQLLAKNLPDVCQAIDHYPGQAKIIIVDDGSSELGTEALVNSFQYTHYIQHRYNQGFSAAVFTGITAAETELIFLLNSDVSPSSGAIAPLANALQDNTIFAASPLIFNEDGSANSYSLNQYYWAGLNLTRRKWTQEKLKSMTDSPSIKHLFCSGGSVMLRRSRFLLMGGFAEMYQPYYCEDLDLGAQAWRRGWQSVLVPQSTVVHQEEGSISSEEKTAHVKTIQRRNAFLFEWSHLSWYRLLCFGCPFWLRQLLGRLIKGDTVYLKGLLLALGQLPTVASHRTTIKKNSIAFTFEALLDLLNTEDDMP